MKDFNFLKEYYALSRHFSEYKKKAKLSIIIICIFVLVIALWLPNKILNDYHTKLETINKRLDDINVIIKDKLELKDQLKHMEDLIQIADQLEFDTIKFSELYRELMQIIPNDIDIEILDFNTNQLNINGYAYTKTVISQMISDIKQIKLFKQVKLENIIYTDGDSKKNKFTLKCICN